MASVALRFRAVGGLEPGLFFAAAVLTGTLEFEVGSVDVAAIAGVFDRVARVIAPEAAVAVAVEGFAAAVVFVAFPFAMPVPLDSAAGKVPSFTSARTSSSSLASTAPCAGPVVASASSILARSTSTSLFLTSPLVSLLP